MRSTAGFELASQELGAELRRLRRGRGLAQRDLCKPLHLGSHSAIVDYEAGRRIPPEAVIGAYERFFGIGDGVLRALRDKALAERAAAETGVRPGRARVIPRQLPAGPASFTGRAGELAQLDRLLRDRESTVPVVISAVSGMGGIGKTALAVHWAHQARDSFGDGELYIDMQGYHPSGRPVAAEAAMGQFLVALGVAADQVPVELAERAGLYRTLMADRQMLVLLDNVRDVEQVRPLLPGSARCRVLITSRSRLAGLAVREGAQRIALDSLDAPDAVRLLRRLIGPRSAEQPGATSALASLCGLHPLALRIAAERVALSDGAVSDAVRELSAAAGRLANLAIADDEAAAIQAVFAWSYKGLAGPERRLFRLLGLHDGPDIAVAPCAALAGLAVAQCAAGLAALTDAHLVEPVAGGRYRLHDLLRLFARDCLASDEPAAGRSAAALRVGAWYLVSACAARTALDPNLPPLAAVEAELPVPAMAFGSESAALSWCDSERANLTATALSAVANDLHEIGWRLPTALFPYFDRRRNYGDWIITHRAAITAAHAAGDVEAEGKARCNLGSGYRPMRRFDEAVAEYEKALELFRACGWRQGQAKALGNLASTRADMGDYEPAIAVGLRALRLFEELGDEYGQALCLANLGNSFSASGQQDEAMAAQGRAHGLFSALGDRRGAARARAGMGMALSRTGRHAEAVAALSDSARAFGEVGDPHERAVALADLARVLLTAGDRREAARHAAAAAEIYSALGEDWHLPGLSTLLDDQA